MQKLWLKDFEFQIIPNTWNAAQELIQAGAVQNLQEVERHFWVATVADAEFQYEIEVMITPQKIKAFTCECWGQGRRLMCAHIAASLYKVRQFLGQKTEDRQAKVEAEQREKTGRLSVQNILAHISPGDLSAFVREFARRDRDFALALKTRFASVLTENENPYLLVLEAALPRHADSRTLITTEFRRLCKALDDLEVQARAAADEANAQRVVQIGAAVLRLITLVAAKSDDARRSKLQHYCQASLQRMTQLSREYLSPGLRETRRQLLFEYINLPDHSAELASSIVLPFLVLEASDNDFFNEIQRLYDQIPFPAPPSILHLFLAALAQRKLPEAVLRVLQDYSDRPAIAKEAILLLYRLHYWEAVLHASEYFLEKNLLLPGQRRDVEDILLAAAEKAGDRPRHAAYLRQRYRQHGHESVLQRLKALAGPDWPQEQEKLLFELHASGDDAKTAQLLAVEGDLDALAIVLSKMGGLDVLRQYEQLFWPSRTAFVKGRYLHELATHLDSHFGKQASDHVRDQLAGLVSKNQTDLAQEIVAGLIAQFPDRQTLSGELAEIFPRAKRKTILATLSNK